MEPVKTPKQSQRKREVDDEQECEHMKAHKNPRCLKWGAWRERPSEASIRRGSHAVKRVGEKSASLFTPQRTLFLTHN